MNKTVTINIGGSLFVIDENAYVVLKEYIDSVKAAFSSLEGGEEIIADIEVRIAELFKEKMEANLNAAEKNIITKQIVEEVKVTIGNPKEFGLDDDDLYDDSSDSEEKSKIKRILYRDTNNRVIGGVCAGLSRYMDIKVSIVRLIFVLSLIAGVIPAVAVYLILLILVPKAKSPAQILEMKGESLNMKNIKNSLKDDLDEVKSKYSEARESKEFKRGSKEVTKFLYKVGDLIVRIGELLLSLCKIIYSKAVVILSFIWLIFKRIFSVIFTIFALVLLVFAISFISMPIQFLTFIDSRTWFMIFVEHTMSTPLFISTVISIGLVALIPALLILFGVTKMTFKYKSNSRAIALTAFGVWIAALITTAMLCLYSKWSVNMDTESTIQTEQINSEDYQGLTVKIESPEDIENYIFPNFSQNRRRELDVPYITKLPSGEESVAGGPIVTILKSESSEFSYRLRVKSRGRSSRDADDFSKKVDFNVQLKDSVILIDQFFTIEESKSWRGQRVYVDIFIPEGEAVIFDGSVSKIINREGVSCIVCNSERVRDKDIIKLINRPLLMSKGVLNMGLESEEDVEAVNTPAPEGPKSVVADLGKVETESEMEVLLLEAYEAAALLEEAEAKKRVAEIWAVKVTKAYEAEGPETDKEEHEKAVLQLHKATEAVKLAEAAQLKAINAVKRLEAARVSE